MKNLINLEEDIIGIINEDSGDEMQIDAEIFDDNSDADDNSSMDSDEWDDDDI